MLIVAGVLAIVIVGGGFWYMSRPVGQASKVEVKIPSLSAAARAGQARFSLKCAGCHGAAADGTDQGPPLIHRIYEPGHHGDYAFVMAVRNGVRAHHWRFGNMPPVAGVDDREIRLITRFIREVQRANGIM